nr:DUF2513 domain-containing protein [Pantoea agglomerans]
MKIDQKYLRDLLIAFEDSEGPDTHLKELEGQGFNSNSSEFIFHMRLLNDNGLIIRTDGKLGFGHEISRTVGNRASYYWIETPLRLTSRGHDFIANLRQNEVWHSVSQNFKEAGLSTLVDVSKELAKAFALKQVKRLTGFGPE